MVNISDLAKFVLFADDTNIFISHIDRSELYKIANNILQKLLNYCTANRIVLNYEKCCFIEFKNGIEDKNELILSIANHSISKVDTCKFLGVIINSNLKWDDQMAHVKKLLSQSIGALHTIKIHFTNPQSETFLLGITLRS